MVRGTDRALLLAPRLTRMPLPMQRYDDPFLPFGKAIIAATQEVVCAYIFDLASYLAIGAAGAVALERTIASVDDQTVTILHGPFVGAGYLDMAEAFEVDALTLIDPSDADVYQMAGFGVFVVLGALSARVDGTRLVGRAAHDGVTLGVTFYGENALYTGRGDDFADQIRAKLQ